MHDDRMGDGMNIETVNELIQSLESAGELSIKERKYLELAMAFKRVAAERDAALNAERVWERAMMEVCGEDGPASVASEIRALQVLRDTRIQALNSQVEQLAAENVALKSFGGTLHEIKSSLVGGGHGHMAKADMQAQSAVMDVIFDAFDAIETPATDRIAAGIKADGVEEFAAHLRANDNGASVCKMIALGADEFAQQLCEGAKLA